MRLLFTGGGTAGSLAPLVAVAEQFRDAHRDVEILFLVSKHPADRAFVEQFGFLAKSISSGKWRRYLSPRNLVDPFLMLAGFMQSWRFLRRWRPDVVVSAGSFVSVPVAYAAKRSGIPVAVHQQDVLAGLANKTMARVASLITVAFESSLKDFPNAKRVLWTGNPVRPDLQSGKRARGRKHFDIAEKVPMVLVLGGSSGARALNVLMEQTRDALVQRCHVVHVCGRNGVVSEPSYRYSPVEFLGEELADAYAAADLVVCRAGLSTISELAALGKAALIIPMPDSHQERNAALLRSHSAAVIADERSLTADVFVQTVTGLLENEQQRRALGTALHALNKENATQRLHDQILTLIPHR